jgi:hypothetical protein
MTSDITSRLRSTTASSSASLQACTQAWVLTDRDNTAAMRLYASVGGDPGSQDRVMFDFKL